MQGHRSLSSGIVAMLALVVFLAARGAWANDGSPPPETAVAPEETPGLESVLDLVRGQKKLIDVRYSVNGTLPTTATP